jgi:photosystem II stability/assembly factor-like uncharacterized protein
MKTKNSSLKLIILMLCMAILVFIMGMSDNGCSSEPTVNPFLEYFVLSLGQDELSIEAGSSAIVSIGGNWISTFGSTADSFKVEIIDSNTAGIIITGCDIVIMLENYGSCVLTIAVPANTIADNYTLQLQGTAFGTSGSTRVTPASIIIMGLSPATDFTVEFETNNITVEQGNSDTIPINITRINNNTEGIDFQINSQPSGFNGTISPSSNVTGNSTDYMLTVDQLMSPGNYPVVVTGTGLATAISNSDTLIVTITALPPLWVNETPPGFESRTFRDVFFVNENEGVTVGDDGVILRSGDGGQTWSDESGVTNSHLAAAHSNGSVWYTVGGNNVTGFGEIIRKTSGTWKIIVDTIPLILNDVFVIDDNNIWTVGVSGVAYNTTDGGTTWNANDSIVSGFIQFSTIWFANSSEGYIGTSGSPAQILKTNNGGDDWNQVGTSFEVLHDLFFIDSQKGYAVHSQGIEVTTTGGGSGTWSFLSTTPPGIIGMVAISFWGTQVGLIVGGSASQPIVLRTENGDASWEYEQIGFSTPILWAVATLNDAAAVAVGQGIIARRQ